MDVKRSARAWMLMGALATCIAMALMTTGPGDAFAEDGVRTPGKLYMGDGPVSGDPDTPTGNAPSMAPPLDSPARQAKQVIGSPRKSAGPSSAKDKTAWLRLVMPLFRLLGIRG